MNLYEAQEFFKNMYPGKKIEFEFDEKCHRTHELIYTDGIPNPIHHVENNKVKMTVEGMNPIYIPIAPHRECYGWDQIKKLINSKSDVFIHPKQIEAIKNASDSEKNLAISELENLTGLRKEQILSKIGI